MSEYQYKDGSDGSNRISTSRFRDTTGCSEDDIDFESAATKNGERLSYFCTEIPGEASWVAEGFKAQDPTTEASVPAPIVGGGEKRARDDDDEVELQVASGGNFFLSMIGKELFCEPTYNEAKGRSRCLRCLSLARHYLQLQISRRKER